MAFNPIVQIISLGTLAGMTGCSHSKPADKTKAETTVNTTVTKTETKTETAETITETTDSRFSKECQKDFDLNAPCTLEGAVCPPPESMNTGFCSPPDEVTCMEGKWLLGPMPTCNPPPLEPPPTPPK